MEVGMAEEDGVGVGVEFACFGGSGCVVVSGE